MLRTFVAAATGLAAASVPVAADKSSTTLWLRSNGQKCSDMWSEAIKSRPNDTFAPTILDKLLGGASSLCSPNSFGGIAVNCGATVGTTAGTEFVEPDSSDSAAISDIVKTFGSQGWGLTFVVDISSAAQAKNIIAGVGSFSARVKSYLAKTGFTGFQVDLRNLERDDDLVKPLTHLLLSLSKEVAVPVSVVITGSSSASESNDPIDLATIGAASTGAVAPLTVVTTGTFSSNSTVLESIVNTTSDGFGSAAISGAVYAPGLSMSDEYDEFKPKMYELWDKFDFLKARNVTKVGKCWLVNNPAQFSDFHIVFGCSCSSI